MNIRSRIWWSVFSLSMVLLFAASARAQELPGQAGRNVSAMKLTTIPGLPTCAKGSVQSGDPTSRASIIFARIPTGCSIPWHWHTPNEHVILVSGIGHLDMKDGPPLTLRAGGFALMAARHVHQFRCERACQLYIYSDLAFDIHYVNAQGNEISPAEALKAVKEKAATEMK